MRNVREDIMETLYPTNGDFFVSQELLCEELERFLWIEFVKIKFQHFYEIRDNIKAIYENKVGDPE